MILLKLQIETVQKLNWLQTNYKLTFDQLERFSEDHRPDQSNRRFFGAENRPMALLRTNCSPKTQIPQSKAPQKLLFMVASCENFFKSDRHPIRCRVVVDSEHTRSVYSPAEKLFAHCESQAKTSGTVNV